LLPPGLNGPSLIGCVSGSWEQARYNWQIGSEVTDNDESRGEFSARNADDRVLSDRVQELSWAVIDEQINDDEFHLLDNLLLSDEKARSTYLGCAQLHADLMSYFAVPSAEAAKNLASNSQVLGFLNAGSPIGFEAPSEDVIP
jgi:hypothetical protein